MSWLDSNTYIPQKTSDRYLEANTNVDNLKTSQSKRKREREREKVDTFEKNNPFSQALKLISDNMGISPFINRNVSSYFQLGFMSGSDYTNFLQIGVFSGSFKLLSGIQVSLLNAAQNTTPNSIQIGFMNIAGNDSGKKDSADIKDSSCGIQIGLSGNICFDKLNGGLQFGFFNSQFPFFGIGVSPIYLAKQSPAYAFVPEALKEPVIDEMRASIPKWFTLEGILGSSTNRFGPFRSRDPRVEA